MVLIMYRKDGNGGIQGIIIDSFYVDHDGKIANEFYIVTDSEEGKITKLKNMDLCKLQNGQQI